MLMPQNIIKLLLSNIVSLITVAGGILVIYLDQVGLIQSNELSRYILLLIAGLATTELIDKSRKLQDIEKKLDKGFEHTISTLNGVSVQNISSLEEAFEQSAIKISKLNSSFDQASISPPMPRPPSSKKYETEIETAVKKRGVKYRYLTLSNQSVRSERIKRFLSDPKISSFYAGIYKPTENTIPMIGFMILDDTEVIVHYPLEYGENYNWMVIKHPEIVRMFKGYFRHLWADSIKIDHNKVLSGEFDELVSGNET